MGKKIHRGTKSDKKGLKKSKSTRDRGINM